MKFLLAEFDHTIDLELYATTPQEEAAMQLMINRIQMLLSMKAMRSPSDWQKSGIKLSFSKKPKGGK